MSARRVLRCSYLLLVIAAILILPHQSAAAQTPPQVNRQITVANINGNLHINYTLLNFHSEDIDVVMTIQGCGAWYGSIISTTPTNLQLHQSSSCPAGAAGFNQVWTGTLVANTPPTLGRVQVRVLPGTSGTYPDVLILNLTVKDKSTQMIYNYPTTTATVVVP